MIYLFIFRAFCLYDIQFEHAKFIKLNKRGRKKADEKDKENVPVNVNPKYLMYNGVEWHQTQLDQLHSLLNSFISIKKTFNEYNYVQQQHQLKVQQQQQQQLFPIFSKDKSILLARPQTPKTKRVSHRQKKNAAALQI